MVSATPVGGLSLLAGYPGLATLTPGYIPPPALRAEQDPSCSHTTAPFRGFLEPPPLLLVTNFDLGLFQHTVARKLIV